MTTDFVSVPVNWTVRQALDHVRKVGRSAEQIYAVYLLDPQSQQLKQTSSLRQLLIADPNANVTSAAPNRPPITVKPETDREEVARLISKYDLLAVPVLDEVGKVMGIVTVDDVIDAIVAESTEDVQKFGGVEALNAPYMRIGFLSMIKKRAGWLSALFLSEMLTASAMQHYSTELEKAVVLTLFIPSDHELWWELGLTSNFPRDPGPCTWRVEAHRLVEGSAAGNPNRPCAWKHPRCDWHPADRGLAEARYFQLRGALAACRVHGWNGADRHCDVRLFGGINPAVPPEEARVRPRKRIRPFCSHARGRDGSRHLLQHRPGDIEGHLALTHFQTCEKRPVSRSIRPWGEPRNERRRTRPKPLLRGL